MEDFKLENQEYIQLNQLLKATGLVGTGGEAMIRIDEGNVKVNGAVETQRRKKTGTTRAETAHMTLARMQCSVFCCCYVNLWNCVIC